MIDHGFGVQLDTINPEDVMRMRGWRNNAKIRKWCRQYDLISYRDQENWYDELSSRSDVRMYAIRMRNLLIGVCGLTDIDLINRRAEFSCYVAPEHQCKGHAKRALRTLFSHGFMALGLNGIWGETFDGNPAAKLFECLGMTKEGSRRDYYFRDGHFIDAHLYSLLRSDWDTLLSAWQADSGWRTTGSTEPSPAP